MADMIRQMYRYIDAAASLFFVRRSSALSGSAFKDMVDHTLYGSTTILLVSGRTGRLR